MGMAGGMGGMGSGMAMGGSMTGQPMKVWDPEKPKSYAAPLYAFKVQMIWQETPLSKRIEEQAKKAAAAEEEAKQKVRKPAQLRMQWPLIQSLNEPTSDLASVVH